MPKTALILSSGRTGSQFLAHDFDESHSGLRERCRELDRIGSPLMQEFGYGGEPVWCAQVAPDG